MNHRGLASLGALAAVIAIVSLAAAPAAGPTSLASFVGVADQPPPRLRRSAEVSTKAEASGEGAQAARAAAKTTAPAKTAKAWTPPRTPDGQPDLQGTWTNHTITPLERPSALAGKEVLAEEEASALEEQAAERSNADRGRQVGSDADVGLAYNEFWWDRATTVVDTKRTSLIVDPPDGKIPPLTPEAQERAKAEPDRRPLRATGGFQGGRDAGSWLDRSLWERCITQGLPRISSNAYNSNIEIVQGPDYVVIHHEMIHEARVVPLDGRPHLDPRIRQYLGDSRGHWEGKTLVVDTTNFGDMTNFRGSTTGLHMVERFTRVDADTLNYEVTFDDPTTWTRPWTAAIPWKKSQGQIYEYACHEGNYGMTGILSGGRAEEKAAEEAAKK